METIMMKKHLNFYEVNLDNITNFNLMEMALRFHNQYIDIK